MKTNLNYCIVLSAEQLIYLAGSKYGIDRMKILLQLIEATVLKETEYAIKGFSKPFFQKWICPASWAMTKRPYPVCLTR